MDTFHGEIVSHINLAGLSHIISVSHGPIPSTSQTDESSRNDLQNGTATLLAESEMTLTSLPLIHFRVYIPKLFKSGQKEPRIELEECGPRFDFKLKRNLVPLEDLWTRACKRRTSTADPKKKKRLRNVDIDEMGDKVGRIHVGRQDLEKLQSRKIKGLKKDFKESEESPDEGFSQDDESDLEFDNGLAEGEDGIPEGEKGLFSDHEEDAEPPSKRSKEV